MEFYLCLLNFSINLIFLNNGQRVSHQATQNRTEQLQFQSIGGSELGSININDSAINDPNLSIMPLGGNATNTSSQNTTAHRNRANIINRQISQDMGRTNGSQVTSGNGRNQSISVNRRAPSRGNMGGIIGGLIGRHRQNQSSVATIQTQSQIQNTTTQSRVINNRFRRNNRTSNRFSRASQVQRPSQIENNNTSQNLTQIHTTEETMMRTQNDEEYSGPSLQNIQDRLDPFDQTFVNRQEYEQYLIDNASMRTINIREQVDNFIAYFLVYLVFIASLLIQLTFFPHVKALFPLLVLIVFHSYKTIIYGRRFLNKKLNHKQSWQRMPSFLRAFENSIYTVVWTMILFYVSYHDQIHVTGMSIAAPAVLACAISCFCIRYEETPCNATMQLMTKVIIVLRLLIGFSALLKLDKHTQWDLKTKILTRVMINVLNYSQDIINKTFIQKIEQLKLLFLHQYQRSLRFYNYFPLTRQQDLSLINYEFLILMNIAFCLDWSTTFWPYWCSFAIQGIMGIASLIIFLNTALNYLKEESTKSDILASFWAFIVCGGFVVSTLLPIINIIQIFDFNGDLNYKGQAHDQGSQSDGSSQSQAKLQIPENMIPFVILRYPLIYLIVVVIMTIGLKSQIISWFEHVLYIDEDDQTTFTGDEENDQQSTGEAEQEMEKTVHIRTYKFKTPQFIKKLTNTYFKKSRKEEKQRILRRDMLSHLEDAKISHKKNKSESFSKPHKREFSMFSGGNSPTKIQHKIKPSKHYKKEDDFFEFQDSNRPHEQELTQIEVDQNQVNNLQNSSHKQNKQNRKNQQRFMSQDFRKDNPGSQKAQNEQQQTYAKGKIRQDSINRMSVSLSSKECCICFDSKPDAVIMECGHGGICYECGKHMIATEPRVCHLCREGIAYILKMDLSTVYSNFIKVISATFIDEDSDEEGEQEKQSSSPDQDQNQQSINPQVEQDSQVVSNFDNLIPQPLNQDQILSDHNRQKSKTISLDQHNSAGVLQSHQRGNSMIFQSRNQDDQPVYYMQNPFYNKGGQTANQQNMQMTQNSQIQIDQNVIEFVSPRPQEEEDKAEEDFNAFQSSFGGNNMLGNQGNYMQFREIQEEIKEEEELDFEENARKQSFLNYQENGVEEYKKQLSSRKFKLFQVKKKDKNDGNSNMGNFYKFENVSNPDSVILSARSSRLSNLDQNEQNNQNDFSSSQKFNKGAFIGLNYQDNLTINGNDLKSFRESLKSSQEFSKKIKVHKQKRANRNGSIYLVEEFLAANDSFLPAGHLLNQNTNFDDGNQNEYINLENSNYPNIYEEQIQQFYDQQNIPNI